MPIPVICTTCKARFQVNEKFAGKQGPCPKCKAVITIPKLEDQVQIHAPDEFAGGATTVAKDAKGRSVLKPIARVKAKIEWVTLGIWGGTFLLLVIAALLLRTMPDLRSNPMILGLGGVLIGVWMVYPSYQTFRDRELEPLLGMNLLWRLACVAAIFAASWGLLFGVQQFFFEGQPLNFVQLLIFIPAPTIIAGLAAMALLETEIVPGLLQFIFYLALGILFRIIAGLPPIPFMDS